MEARCQEFGGPLGRVAPGKGFGEGGFRDQEPGSEAIAQNFDVSRTVRQVGNVAVFERVDPARMKHQMRKLVKQSEYLTGLSGAVVDVDNREYVVIETEAGIPIHTERVLEHEHADVGEC